MDNNVNNDLKQYIILRFDSEQYGIDISYIDNIVRLMPITRVPHTQPYFLGVINLRGVIIPVMSMREKFDLPFKENTGATRILIIKYDGADIGVLVDEVKEVVTLNDDSIEKVTSDDVEARSYVTGVGKYNDTLISILNIPALIADIENEIKKLIDDDEVDAVKGIYEYIIDGAEKHLSLRTFDDKIKELQTDYNNMLTAIIDLLDGAKYLWEGEHHETK